METGFIQGLIRIITNIMLLDSLYLKLLRPRIRILIQDLGFRGLGFRV